MQQCGSVKRAHSGQRAEQRTGSRSNTVGAAVVTAIAGTRGESHVKVSERNAQALAHSRESDADSLNATNPSR